MEMRVTPWHFLIVIIGSIILSIMLCIFMIDIRDTRRVKETPSQVEARMKEKINFGQDIESLTSYLESEQSVGFHLDDDSNTLYFERRFPPVGFLGRFFGLTSGVFGELKIEQNRIAKVKIRQIHTGP